MNHLKYLFPMFLLNFSSILAFGQHKDIQSPIFKDKFGKEQKYLTKQHCDSLLYSIKDYKVDTVKLIVFKVVTRPDEVPTRAESLWNKIYKFLKNEYKNTNILIEKRSVSRKDEFEILKNANYPEPYFFRIGGLVINI